MQNSVFLQFIKKKKNGFIFSLKIKTKNDINIIKVETYDLLF